MGLNLLLVEKLKVTPTYNRIMGRRRGDLEGVYNWMGISQLKTTASSSLPNH